MIGGVEKQQGSFENNEREKRQALLKDFLNEQLSLLEERSIDTSDYAGASNEFVEAMLEKIVGNVELTSENLDELSGLLDGVDSNENNQMTSESVDSQEITRKLQELHNKTIITLYSAGRNMYRQILIAEANENRTGRAAYVNHALLDQTEGFFNTVPVLGNVVATLRSKDQ